MSELVRESVPILTPSITTRKASATLSAGDHESLMTFTASASAWAFGSAAAIGVKLAAPDRPVVALIGDGGFGQNPVALATALADEIAVVWVIMNNQAFGTIAVAGPPECTAAFLRSIALELACGNDLADAYVSIVDVEVDPLVAPRHRLAAQTLTDAIATAENAIDSVNSAIRHDSKTDTFRARVGGSAPIEATVGVAAEDHGPPAGRCGRPLRGAHFPAA